MNENAKNLKQTASALLLSDFRIMPVKKNKHPLLEGWTDDTFALTEEQIFNFIDQGYQLGLITGKQSGVTVIDIDYFSDGVFGTDPDLFPETYTVQTPSGAIQKYYQFDEKIPQSQKNIPDFPCVDIRNQGGQVLIPPSQADYTKTFANGSTKHIIGEYKIISGSILDLSPFPRHLFEKYSVKKIDTPHTPHEFKHRPGDEFEQTVSWKDILAPFGWIEGHTDRKGSRHWTRPNKKGEATSATTRTNDDGRERLFVFSTQAAPFETYDELKHNSYTKITAYAALRHNGDFRAAIDALKSQGYGVQQELQQPAIAPKLPQNAFIIKNMEDITPKAIKWLWDQKIAKGKLTLIAGHPGLGKSQISLSIAAAVSNGSPWYGTTENREEKQVIVLSAEDAAEDTIVPRLIVCKATQTNIKILEAVREEKGGIRSFDLTKDIQNLRALFKQLGNVGCVVIDPITAYLGEADSHKNAEVRAVLSQFTDIAAEFGVAIIAVTHLNKSGNTNAQMSIMGSLAFVAAARAAWLVAKDEDDKRYFVPMKNNLAVDSKGLTYELESVSFSNSFGEEIKTSKIVWNGETDKKADDLLKTISKKTGRPDAEKEEAKEFLSELLNENPDGLSKDEILASAKAAGISARTIARAREEMGIESISAGTRNARKWKRIKMYD